MWYEHHTTDVEVRGGGAPGPGAAVSAVPAYSSKFSKKPSAQHQHLAVLTVQQFLRVDYRGIAQHLKDWSDLRAELGLADAPDHSAIRKAAERLLEQRGGRAAHGHRYPGRLGSVLRTRLRTNQHKEVLLRVVVHNLMILAAT